MKLYILIALLIMFLSLSCICANAQDNFSPLLPELQDKLNEMDLIQQELREILPEFNSKGDKINSILKKINGFAIFTLPKACKKGTNKNFILLERKIKQLETLQCLAERKYILGKTISFCIPSQTFESFIPRFKSALEDIKAVIIIDENSNKIPDVCESSVN